ncbi:hypothetical protein DL93DRAFT_2053341, partial [Clavulina sp. PMI_390]
LLSTRDLVQLRTLLSITFRWNIEPKLIHICDQLGSSTAVKEIRCDQLASQVRRLWRFVFPAHMQESVSTSTPSTSSQAAARTQITQAIISYHLVDLFRPSLLLMSLREEHRLHPSALDIVDELQSDVSDSLHRIAASQIVAALGTTMTASPSRRSLPEPTRKLCSRLLSEQILRQDGVTGLFFAMFDESDIGEDAPLSKLEQIARLLTLPPHNMQTKAYYDIVVPKLIEILKSQGSGGSSTQPAMPRSYVRAASFTLARMMSKRAPAEIVTPVLRQILCTPFLVAPENPPALVEQINSPQNSGITVSESITIFNALFLNADPSPAMIHLLLYPIITPLYSLVAFLEKRRGVISDAALQEKARGLLITWSRIAAARDVVKGWWNIIRGTAGWGMDDGSVLVSGSVLKGPLSSRIPTNGPDKQDLVLTGDTSLNDVGLELWPDPVHVIGVLKDLGRKEVSGALFVRCLDEYQARVSPEVESTPMQTILLLNVVLEMIQQLGSSILQDVNHILSFVAHALEPPQTSATLITEQRPDNKLVDSDDEDEDDGPIETEEDEGHPVDGVPTRQDMLFTALNLLLAILEGNPDTSPTTTPLLQVIFSHLEALTDHQSETIRKTSQEARLVITARNASSATGQTLPTARRSDHEIFQEALKLVQDPILPVRAHGLLMLRQLIIPPRPIAASAAATELDPALVPAILDVFMQSVQDEDSFVFLNAVQGLSAMVDRLGRGILVRLMDVYANGESVRNGSMSKTELDKRLRVGEALVQVVRRCGETLPAYADILVPGLSHLFRSKFLPTNLRSSAISVLATSAEVSSIALLPWAEELTSGMVDLLQLESVSFDKRVVPDGEDSTINLNAARHKEEDAVPALTLSSKAPTLRRSALHFLSLLLRAAVIRLYEIAEQVESPLNEESMRRIRRVVSYVGDTDVDGIVRAQAAECTELLDQLLEARLTSAVSIR